MPPVVQVASSGAIQQLEWSDYCTVFQWDGSLIDLYVLETNSTDWQLLTSFLAESENITFTLDGKPALLRGSITNLLTSRDSVVPLSIDLGGIVLNGHLYEGYDIEFDLDPREIGSEANAQRLF